MVNEHELMYYDEPNCSGRKIRIEYHGMKVGVIKVESKKTWDGPIIVKCVDNHGDFSFRCIGRCNTILEAKRLFASHFSEKEVEHKRRNRIVERLPSENSDDFFPTPPVLAGKMIAKANWKNVQTILEPSAGKGDLVESILCMLQQNRYRNGRFIHEQQCTQLEERIDCVEADVNLRYILQGKGFKVVGDDFMTYQTNKWYDIIVMNPPFSAGDQHLMKAISMQEESGGQIVCLLNAETVRNPYSNIRKVLSEKLKQHKACIEFLKNGFIKAERTSDVEIAIVYIHIPPKREKSFIFEHLKKAQQEKVDVTGPEDLVAGDWMQKMIAGYNHRAMMGVSLMREYASLLHYLLDDGINLNYPLIQLRVGKQGIGKDMTSADLERYLKELRSIYWNMLFNRSELTSLMTSNMRKEYSNKVESLSAFEFSEFNIKRVMTEIGLQLQSGVEESIMDMFEKFSAEHSWYPECKKNIHYYNGWATNKAHKVGMKVIIPIHGAFASSWEGKKKLDEFQVVGIINDLERALNYLDSGRTESHLNVAAQVRGAIAGSQTKIEFTWFTATFYKKGTCHIKFKEESRSLIERLNIFASRKKGWLPPNYGKVHYGSMDDESKAVIDSFQGKEEYERVLDEKDFFLGQAGLLALEA